MSHRRPSESPTALQPEISVIIPFDDPRGDPRFVQSWTQTQTCASHRFEVIVISSGASSELDAALRVNLRPHDQLVRTSATNRFGFYDPGARAARGKLLLLTEDHCVADRECIATALDHFAQDPELCGAFLEGGHINRTAFARMEQRIYEKMFAEYWSRPDWWDKLRIRGTVLARDAYFAQGGLVGDYDHFSEALLSARLHVGGYQMGYVPGALVKHVNTTSFAMMQPEVERFALGEFRYRGDSADPELEPFLGLPIEWSERHLRTPKLARRAVRALTAVIRESRRRGDRQAASRLAACKRAFLLDAYCGPRWRAGVAHGKIAWAKLRYTVERNDEWRRADLVSEFWRAANELGRIRAAVKLAQPPRGIALDGDGAVPIGATSSSDLIGFHAAEAWQGISFRWASSVAVVPLAVEPGNYELTIDTAGLRGSQCDFPWVLMWNDKLLPTANVRVGDGCIRATVTADLFVHGEPQHLMIACAPPPPNPGGPVDPRALGMPLRAIALTPVHAAHGQKRIDLQSPHWQASRVAGHAYAQQS